MTKRFKSSPDYKEPNPQTLAATPINTFESVKDPRQLLHLDANSCIANVDAQITANPPTPDKDSPARLGILDGICQQIPQNAAQKDTVAHYT
jgi:hypothetical protein